MNSYGDFEVVGGGDNPPGNNLHLGEAENQNDLLIMIICIETGCSKRQFLSPTDLFGTSLIQTILFKLL